MAAEGANLTLSTPVNGTLSPACDMYALGTMLSGLLFGQCAKEAEGGQSD
jgi:hypothetical protein